MFFNEFVTLSSIDCPVNLPAASVDRRRDQNSSRFANIPRQCLQRGYPDAFLSECRYETLRCCQADSQSGKRTRPTCGGKDINIFKAEGKILKEELDGSKQ